MANAPQVATDFSMPTKTTPQPDFDVQADAGWTKFTGTIIPQINNVATYLSANGVVWADDSGTANNYVLTPSPALTGYAQSRLMFKAVNDSATGAVHVDVSGLGNKLIKNTDGTDANILSDELTEIIYSDSSGYFIKIESAGGGAVADDFVLLNEVGSVNELSLTGGAKFKEGASVSIRVKSPNSGSVTIDGHLLSATRDADTAIAANTLVRGKTYKVIPIGATIDRLYLAGGGRWRAGKVSYQSGIAAANQEIAWETFQATDGGHWDEVNGYFVADREITISTVFRCALWVGYTDNYNLLWTNLNKYSNGSWGVIESCASYYHHYAGYHIPRRMFAENITLQAGDKLSVTFGQSHVACGILADPYGSGVDSAQPGIDWVIREGGEI